MSGGLIVTEGKKIALDRIYNHVPTRNEISKFKIGIGTVDVVMSNTNLGHAIPIAGTEEVDDCEATTGWADSADCTLSVNSTTYKEGTASLNWTKDGVASVNCYSEKTSPSLDFTSKELSLWMYVIDATALAKLAITGCLVIRYGSDSSNYYQWTKNKTNLTAGQWNLIDGLTVATASTTGTPVIASMDYIRVGLVSAIAGNTWSDGDFMIDDIKIISIADYIKDFEAGYPDLDYTKLQASVRCRVSTVQANGYPITEFGTFNTDATPKMESRDTFNQVSKTATDEIILIAKNLIE